MKVHSTQPRKEIWKNFVSCCFEKWRRYHHLMKIFLSLLVQIDFPRIINFLIPSFYIFSSISTFYIVFYSSWARSNNIFFRQCLLKDLFDPYNNFLFAVSHMIAYLSKMIVILYQKLCYMKNRLKYEHFITIICQITRWRKL